jgi:hypothetical protein
MSWGGSGTVAAPSIEAVVAWQVQMALRLLL